MRVNVSPSLEVGASSSVFTSESSTASSDSNMDCVGGEMAGDSSGWDSTSVSSADSAAEMSGALSAKALGIMPTIRANTNRRAKSRL